MEMPLPIAAYFEADRGDGHAVAECFTPDAVVQDEGHTYRGVDEIRKWRADVAEKFTYTVEPFHMEEQMPVTIVTSRLVGNFPGSPTDLRFFFRLSGDKIATLEIKP